MNNLNSTLIEGVIAVDPLAGLDNVSCIFQISSKRLYKKPGSDKIKEERSAFVVEVLDNLELREACLKFGKKGCGVRVVGRLKESFGTCECGREHPTFVIVAEHVEFRPEYKKTNSTKQKQQSKINKE